MEYWRRNLLMMWISQLLVNIGFAAAFPFIPLHIRDAFGIIDPGLRGYYMARFYFFGVLAYAIFTPLWGALGDRFGIKLMLYRGSFISAFLYPLMGLVPNVHALIALRFVIGSLSGTTIAAQMLVVKTTPNERQGFALGVLGTAIWGGAMLGDVTGGLVVHYFGYFAAFLLCGILFFISGLFVILAKDSEKLHVAPAAARGHKHSHWHSFRARQSRKLNGTFTLPVRAMLVVFLLAGLVLRLNMPYTTLMVEDINGPEKAAYWMGIIAAFAAGAAMISGVVLGALSDKFAEWKLTTPAQLLSAVLMFLSAGTHSLWGFGVCHALNNLAVGGLHSVFQKVTASLVPSTKRGSVLGGATTAFNAGFMLATVVSGAIVKSLGLRSVYYTAAGMLLMMAVSTALIIRHVKRSCPAAVPARRAKSIE